MGPLQARSVSWSGRRGNYQLENEVRNRLPVNLRHFLQFNEIHPALA
jgi:hypothetical protein